MSDTVVRDNDLIGNAETDNASSGPVKHDCSRGGTLRRDCGQSRDVGRGRPEEPNQRRNLGQKGEWETVPSDGHSGVRNQEVQAQQRGKMGGGRGVSSGTQRELSE